MDSAIPVSHTRPGTVKGADPRRSGTGNGSHSPERGYSAITRRSGRTEKTCRVVECRIRNFLISQSVSLPSKILRAGSAAGGSVNQRIMKVMKFGGTSVGKPERMHQVSQLITRDKEQKIVVLSALSGTTNALVEIGNAIAAGEREQAKQQIDKLE